MSGRTDQVVGGNPIEIRKANQPVRKSRAGHDGVVGCGHWVSNKFSGEQVQHRLRMIMGM